jgi:hypothetical protein
MVQKPYVICVIMTYPIKWQGVNQNCSWERVIGTQFQLTQFKQICINSRNVWSTMNHVKQYGNKNYLSVGNNAWVLLFFKEWQSYQHTRSYSLGNLGSTDMHQALQLVRPFQFCGRHGSPAVVESSYINCCLLATCHCSMQFWIG